MRQIKKASLKTQRSRRTSAEMRERTEVRDRVSNEVQRRDLRNLEMRTGIFNRAAIIALITLFCPIFLIFWDSDLNTTDKYTFPLISIITAISLTYIIGFAKQKMQKILLSVLFALSIPGNIIVWSNFYVTNQWMKVAGLWVIFSTNTSETGEYLSQFTDIINLIVAILYILVGIILISTLKSNKSYSLRNSIVNKIFFPLSAISVATIIIFTYLVAAVPAFSPYHSFIKFIAYNKKAEKMLHIKDTMSDIPCYLKEDIPHTFVVVIGESTSAYHQSIYGYYRKTTPYQDSLHSQGELIVYDNVLTPNDNTRDALAKILSFANHENQKAMLTLPNIVDIVNFARLQKADSNIGKSLKTQNSFKSYFLNNQEITGMYQSPVCYACSMNADTFIDFKSKTDAPIIEAFKNIVKDSGTNKVIFIHLIGSHFAYNNRYPENFETFGGDKREQGTTQEVENASEAAKYERKKSATIDSYDNSILFGDYILHQLIEALRATGNSSFLVFFSDHGEEVYEDGGTFLGHNSGLYPTKYRVKVPFVLWRSQKYMEEVPEIVLDTARPYNNEDFIHSLGTLMRLNYPALDSSRSIFSPYFKVRPRIVQNKPFELLNEH